MKNIIIMALLLLSGCATTPTTDDYKSWEPTTFQKEKASEIARAYAVDHLELSPSTLDKMVLQHDGRCLEGKRVLDVDFFDPAYHKPLPETGLYETMLGGFPTYFSVTVDPQTWIVVDHYACEE